MVLGRFFRTPPTSPTSKPASDAAEDGGEDWELVEAAPVGQLAQLVAVDDFVLVEGEGALNDAASCSSGEDGGATTPWPLISDEDKDESHSAQEHPVSGTAELPPPQPLAPPPMPPMPTALQTPMPPMPTALQTPKPPQASEGLGQEASCEKGRPPVDGDSASEGSSTTTDDEPSFRCLLCRGPLFKASEVISANYHAQTSPGYLLTAAHNVHISVEAQTAVYTTGRYNIQDVSCLHCAATLGVTYSGASEARNQWKVGKFLIGVDRLQLPPGVVHPMEKAKY